MQSGPDKTPKQKLLGWVQNKIPDRPIKNFTTDWNDGIAIGALVDSIAPGEFSFGYVWLFEGAFKKSIGFKVDTWGVNSVFTKCVSL